MRRRRTIEGNSYCRRGIGNGHDVRDGTIPQQTAIERGDVALQCGVVVCDERARVIDRLVVGGAREAGEDQGQEGKYPHRGWRGAEPGARCRQRV
jgi:hypothetical protein